MDGTAVEGGTLFHTVAGSTDQIEEVVTDSEH